MLQGNASSIDTSTLGTPVANWSEDGCDVPSFFDSQSLIFDISLCGGKPNRVLTTEDSLHDLTVMLIDYAGSDQTFYQTCTGVCYEDWVLGDPSHYDDAYFEVRYVRVYGEPGELSIIGSSDALAITTLRLPVLLAGLATFALTLVLL